MSSNGMPDHSPYRTVSDSTRCVCGHRWDDHTAGICTASDHGRPRPEGSLYAYEMCACNDFEPAEDDR